MRNQSHLKTRPAATGYLREGRNLRQINVAFDDDTINEIKQKARNSGVSFAEAVRTLVEWGLEA